MQHTPGRGIRKASDPAREAETGGGLRPLGYPPPASHRDPPAAGILVHPSTADRRESRDDDLPGRLRMRRAPRRRNATRVTAPAPSGAAHHGSGTRRSRPGPIGASGSCASSATTCSKHEESRRHSPPLHTHSPGAGSVCRAILWVNTAQDTPPAPPMERREKNPGGRHRRVAGGNGVPGADHSPARGRFTADEIDGTGHRVHRPAPNRGPVKAQWPTGARCFARVRDRVRSGDGLRERGSSRRHRCRSGTTAVREWRAARGTPARSEGVSPRPGRSARGTGDLSTLTAGKPAPGAKRMCRPKALTVPLAP